MHIIKSRLLDDLYKGVKAYTKTIGCSSTEVFVIKAIRSFMEDIEDAETGRDAYTEDELIPFEDVKRQNGLD